MSKISRKNQAAIEFLDKLLHEPGEKDEEFWDVFCKELEENSFSIGTTEYTDLRKKYEKLQAELDKLQWIPASEPPEDDNDVLITDGKIWLMDNYEPKLNRWNRTFIHPTHWMSIILPEDKP